MEPSKTQVDIRNKEVEHWTEEFKKCIESPHYFFTNYVLIDGKRPETFHTEEQFNEMFFKFKDGNFKYRRGRCGVI